MPKSEVNNGAGIYHGPGSKVFPRDHKGSKWHIHRVPEKNEDLKNCLKAPLNHQHSEESENTCISRALRIEAQQPLEIEFPLQVSFIIPTRL